MDPSLGVREIFNIERKATDEFWGNNTKIPFPVRS